MSFSASLAIPERFHADDSEAFNWRQSTLGSYKELGPPDLVYVQRQYTNKTGIAATYHYVTGLDTSSLASIAAYINALTLNLGENQILFGKNPHWKVHGMTYSCWNAFSKVDTFANVYIPGQPEAFTIDIWRNKRPAISDKIWQETYLSAMLRALLLADDDMYYVNGCRKLNPLPNMESAAKFLDAFQALFFEGPTLGCDTNSQVPTLVSNYLVDGFLKFLSITGLYKEGLEALEPLVEQDPEVKFLKAKVLMLSNQEVKAVQLMNSAILAAPRNAYLLELQAEFCQKKGNLDLALDSAIRALDAAPSEFFTWARLASVYTDRKEYDKALLALNSCPMFTQRPLDANKDCAVKLHLPLPTDGKIDELWEIDPTEEETIVDPQLLRLPAPTLKSTFAKAYDLLTNIVKEIGWDALLKYRSEVFLMEDEYHKEVEEAKESANGYLNNVDNDEHTESTEEKPKEAGAPANAVIAKPSQAANEPDTSTTNANGEVIASVAAADEVRNKRLCERWLDNLFMVLYEDVRAYTVWRAEFIHFQSQQLAYKKSALEWEILGMVAYRLKRHQEAVDAFVRSLHIKFSHRVMWKLLDHYMKGISSNHLDADSALDAIVKLTAWNHRWYTEFSPKLLQYLEQLVSIEGLTKVKASVEARYSPQTIVKHMEDTMFKTIEEFGVDGADS